LRTVLSSIIHSDNLLVNSDGFHTNRKAAEIEAARLLSYKAAWTIDKNRIDPLLTSMAKLYAADVAVRATDWAIQTLGGYGYLGDYEVERYYRDARVTKIYEGTSEIQRLAILKQLIKPSS
jgi:acyl-CoA dehydrogenase